MSLKRHHFGALIIHASVVAGLISGLSQPLHAQSDTCFQRSDLETGLVFETPVVISDETLMDVVRLAPDGTVLKANYRNYRPNRPAFVTRSLGGLFTFEDWYADAPGDVSVTRFGSTPDVSDLNTTGGAIWLTLVWSDRRTDLRYVAARMIEVIDVRPAVIAGCTYETLLLRKISNVQRSDGQTSNTEFQSIYLPELMWQSFIPIYEDFANDTIRRATEEDLRFFAGVE